MYEGQGKCIKGFGGGNLRERDHFENLIDGKILKCIFKNWKKGARAGLIWLRIRTVGRLLCNVNFHVL